MLARHSTAAAAHAHARSYMLSLDMFSPEGKAARERKNPSPKTL